MKTFYVVRNADGEYLTEDGSFLPHFNFAWHFPTYYFASECCINAGERVFVITYKEQEVS